MSIPARARMQLALWRADRRVKRIARRELHRVKSRAPTYLLLVFLLFAFGLVGHIDREVEQAQAAAEPAVRLSFDLNDCTPAGQPVNNQIDVTLHQHGDLITLGGCTRYAASNTIHTARILKDRDAFP